MSKGSVPKTSGGRRTKGDWLTDIQLKMASKMEVSIRVRGKLLKHKYNTIQNRIYTVPRVTSKQEVLYGSELCYVI